MFLATNLQIFEINPKFTKWVLQNEQKIQRAKSLPYFLRDNREYWKDKLSPKNQISVLDGRNTVLSRKVIKIEEEIRMNKSFETAVLVNSDGDILIDKRGKSTSVEFTQNECLMMKNGILTHNHPLGWRYNENELGRIGNSFSKADLSMAIAHDLAEIRAVTPLYTFSMKRPDKGWGHYWRFEGHYDRISEEISQKLRNAINTKKLTPEKANVLYFHLLNRQLAKELEWVYIKKKTN